MLKSAFISDMTPENIPWLLTLIHADFYGFMLIITLKWQIFRLDVFAVPDVNYRDFFLL